MDRGKEEIMEGYTLGMALLLSSHGVAHTFVDEPSLGIARHFCKIVMTEEAGDTFSLRVHRVSHGEGLDVHIEEDGEAYKCVQKESDEMYAYLDGIGLDTACGWLPGHDW